MISPISCRSISVGLLLTVNQIMACTVVLALVLAMGLVNCRKRFSTHTATRPLNRSSWNLKYITTSPTWHRMQNFNGAMSMWVSRQIASFTHYYFFFFSFLRHAHRPHFWTHLTHNTSLYVVPAKKVSFWGRKMEFEIWPLMSPPQKRENVD